MQRSRYFDSMSAQGLPAAWTMYDSVGVALAGWTMDTDLELTLPQETTYVLGLASPAVIWRDDDAAGWGWFVDATPLVHDEFRPGAGDGSWLARHRMPAARHVDLLTVLLHEFGHTFGLEHTHDDGELMGSELSVGERRLPWSDLVGAVLPNLD